MEIERLMLGDWVLDTNTGDERIVTCEYLFHANGKMVEPIPLTEGIFERNGIKCQCGMPWYQPLGYVVYEFVYYNHDIELRMKLRYVHELQQALRLCGMTEKANNLKIA